MAADSTFNPYSPPASDSTEPRSRRNYFCLLVSQFLSAFGDNAILIVLIGPYLLAYKAGTLSQEALSGKSAFYTALLFVPYVLLAPVAGFLADRLAKTSVLRLGNILKLLGCGLCALSLGLGEFWKAIGYLIVGTGSAIYGPGKYGILPETVPRERLVKANGTVELLTLIAILAGNFVGASLVDRRGLGECYVYVAGIFGVSLFFNFLMSHTPHHPEVRLLASVREFFSHQNFLLRSPRLRATLLGTALFWVTAAGMKINFSPWGAAVLKLPSNEQVALLAVWLTVGVMLGSLIAGALHKLGDLTCSRSYGYAIALTVAALATVGRLSFWGTGQFVWSGLVLIPGVVLLLILVGMMAGLFLIPLNASLQAESPPEKLGKTIAVQNFLDNIGMIFASGVVLAASKSGIGPSDVFLCFAVIAALVVSQLRIPPKTNGLLGGQSDAASAQH